MTKYTSEFDKTFCMVAKKYGLSKLLLKAVAICESSLNKDAYRYEPGYWERYLKNNPEWNTKDPALVSASHGLFQLMYPTAHELRENPSGPPLTREDLCDPYINSGFGAKYIRKLIDKVSFLRLCDKFYWLSPLSIALARYNGGATGNPDDSGALRTHKYVDKIFRVWSELKLQEKECDDQ